MGEVMAAAERLDKRLLEAKQARADGDREKFNAIMFAVKNLADRMRVKYGDHVEDDAEGWPTRLRRP